MAIYKALISVKFRNALVLSPHRSAVRCTNEAVKVVREASIEEGLPAAAISCRTTSSREATDALMKHEKTAVILATGTLGLYTQRAPPAGPPSTSDPGSVPVFVERTADVEKVARYILVDECFDNGTMCASEQFVVVDAPVEEAVRRQFRAQGGYFLST